MLLGVARARAARAEVGAEAEAAGPLHPSPSTTSELMAREQIHKMRRTRAPRRMGVFTLRTQQHLTSSAATVAILLAAVTSEGRPLCRTAMETAVRTTRLAPEALRAMTSMSAEIHSSPRAPASIL